MKRTLAIPAILLIFTVSMGTAALLSSNNLEVGFPYLIREASVNVFEVPEGNNLPPSDNLPPSNMSQDIPENTKLEITSAKYDPTTNKISINVELTTEKAFSYWGNVYPFIIEIIDSEELDVINSQCFCSEEHYFPTGSSSQFAFGWLSYKSDPLEPIDSDYPLPNSIQIKVHFENKLSSDVFEFYPKDVPENSSLEILSANYNLSSNELTISVELATEVAFIYWGNVHPFLIEIIDSEDLDVINSQCFCSKEHQFPVGSSNHTVFGWLSYKSDPLNPIDNDYPLPDSILIKVYLEGKSLSSDIYELFL
ncbi:MAG: hypothetical protein ACXAC7_19155 [Candidatus Hodarchaeales archaeon]